MLPDERRLLEKDLLPKAEMLVRRNAAPGSLTSKVLQGAFGGPKYRFAMKARELATNWVLG
jgi:hypothetical protein